MIRNITNIMGIVSGIT